MKKLIGIVLLIGLAISVKGQPWLQELEKQRKQKNNELTLHDFQRAFYTYWDKHDVKNGVFIEDGVRKKAPGWKQFKRWEWYWEMNANPETGSFPKTSSGIEYRKYRQSSPKSAPLGDWSVVGPNETTGGYAGLGRINTVAFHPDDKNIFWVGSPSGGIWQTSDAGSTWTVLNDNNDVLGVSDIAIAHDYSTNPIIYIATGDRDGGSLWSLGGGNGADNQSVGVLKSTDGGANWQATGLSYLVEDDMLIGRLLLHPSNNDILIAGTTSGIYKSEDGAATWEKVYSSSYVIDMEFNASEPNVIYASTMSYWNQPVILRSQDAGDSWTVVHTMDEEEYRVELAVTDDNPDVVYALSAVRAGSMGYIYRSNDNGLTFSRVFDGTTSGNNLLGYYSDGTGSDGQGSYDLAFEASPKDSNTVFVGGINTWKSTDGGESWLINSMWTSSTAYNTAGAPSVHADKHVLRYRTEAQDTVLFEGNDGGIYITSNDGASWTDLSNDLYISQLYRLGVSATDEEIVITGLQDNGSKLYYYENWYDVTGGDGMECLVDYSDAGIQYASYANGTLYKTTSYWNSGTVSTISDNISSETGYWVTPYIIHPENPATLYVGYTNVWKTTDRGATFTKISDFSGAKLKAVAQSISNPSYLYVSDAASLQKTEDEGETWTDITGTLPVSNSKITYIEVDDNDPERVWVTMGGFTGSHVFETIDGGENWQDISNGLPNLPAYTIVKDTSYRGKDVLYLGMDRGVYMKVDEEPWIPFVNGLPNVVVTELEIYYDDTNPANNKLRAATYGRGLWETSTYQLASDIFLENQTTVRESFCSSHSQDLVYNIVNEGSETLTSVNVVALFSSTGDRIEHPWTGSLEPGEDTEFTLERVLFPAGENTLKVFIENPNGSSDDYLENDTVQYQYSLFNEALLPYSQDFADLQIPTCWTDELFVENSGIWHFTNELNRTFNSTTAENGFAILDNEYHAGNETNTALRTPMFDFSAFSQITVSFDYHFQKDANAQISFEVSTDAGFSWQELANWSETTTNASSYSETFTSFALTDSVLFRWNYLGQDNSFFALDDIHVSGVSSNSAVLLAKTPEDIGFNTATLSGVANANGENLGSVKFLLGENSGVYTSELTSLPDTVYVNGNTPLSVSVDTLKRNTNYYYKLRAQTGAGDFLESEEQVFSTNNIHLELLEVNSGPYHVSDSKNDTIHVAVNTDGGFMVDNKFQVWISDASGDFTNETLIAEEMGTDVNTINAIIPAGWSSGDGYQIRLESTNPVIETSISGDLSVIYDNIKPKVEISFNVPYPTSQSQFMYYLVADEEVFGLSLEDLTLSNADFLSFTKVDSNVYQGELKAIEEGVITLKLPEGSLEDAAQNKNEQVYSRIEYDLNTSTKSFEELRIELFPNPASDYVQLNLPDNVKGSLLLVNGEGVVLKKMRIEEGAQEVSFNLNGISTGTYFIKLVTDSELYVGKFLKL
jgi:photosystem II stability/assembly factor-like uncharacterized protein